MELYEKTLTSKTLFEGKVVNLKVDTAELPDGREAYREVVEHPGGVCIAAVDEEGYIYLVEQWRYPFAEVVMELPAGKLERGEDPDLAAARELREETGFSCDALRKVGVSYSSPGFCSEVIHLYIADGLKKGQQDLDDGEFLNLSRMPLEDAVQMAVDGRIKDGKSRTLLLLCDKLIER